MTALCSYYGGKVRLAPQIVPWLPRHTVYVEPYTGSAAVFWAKGRPSVTNQNHAREVLNDHDERIMTIYRVCQEPATRAALLARLAYTPYSRSEYQRSRQIQRTWAQHDPVTQAWAILIDLQQSFAHKLGAGWRTGVYSENHAATWANWREALPALMARLDGVYLECDNALAVMRRWDSPQTCFYCDPPYVGADQGHYKGFTRADLQALIATLDTCQGSFVLSGYAACLPDIPASWEVRTLDAYCHASAQGQTNGHDRTRAATAAALGQRQRTEYLWRVDRSATMRPELQALFAPRETTLPLFAED
jgi:DNA adenine methylase